ncbi:hypothetical protein, variant [Verruconis gallopava]|nr:hypothetical protein, variant [Verruconis gallopava]KIW06712.1 hypothetical protein, variant [Verruconis gallopava]
MNEANNLSIHIDSEIIVLHKWLRDHYSAFFPGLERLVENPVQYAKAVAIIGNGPMDVKAVGASADNVVGQSLDKVLDKALLMSVRMEAATTQAKPLPEAEITMITKACQMVLSLDEAKDKIRAFVESRMNAFAPNLSTLIGPETAALLVQAKGSLIGLANTPSNNWANVGWRPSRTGGASNAYGGGARQKGHLFYSPIIKNVPIDHRTQALRIVAAKAALAARTDAVAKTTDNTIGRQLADQVARRLDVLTEAAPNRGPRALPAPDDKPSRKRGGKRARAAKARMQQTELQRMQNRMAFNQAEAEAGYGTGDSTIGLGMIGQETGKIRQTTIDKRTQARLSKRSQALLGTTGGGASGLATSLRGFGQGGGTVTGLRTSGVGTSLGGGAGTASVIAFTDKGFGLELADPRNRDEAERKRKAEEDKYFSTGTFTNVGGGTASMVPQETRTDAGGFKVPALPALKRVKKTG